MARPQLRLLSPEQKSNIHARSIDVLEEVGMYFGSRKALEMFDAVGCEVDWTQGSAKISGDVIEGALKTVPPRFLAAGMDPSRDLDCGGEKLFYTSAGQAPWYRDLDSRQRRPGTSADLIQCTRLVDAIEEIDIHAPLVLPHDVPKELQDLESLRITLEHSRKHFLGGARDEYLAHPSTKRYFRQEHLRPEIFPRESYEAWERRGRSEETLAVNRVKEVLAEPEPSRLPEHVSKELDCILMAARKALCGE